MGNTAGMSHEVTCFTADVSICSMICRLAAVEHNVPNLTHRNIDIECAMENYQPWFVRMQPAMTVPCMKYSEDVIGDSKDIMYYLSEHHPEAGLYPADQKQRSTRFSIYFTQSSAPSPALPSDTSSGGLKKQSNSSPVARTKSRSRNCSS